MNIKNCPKCKKVFNPVSDQLICFNCTKKEEEEFTLLRTYLKENKGADLNKVSEETGISIKKILKYLREGRIEIYDGDKGFLKCEKCGTSIRTGKFCADCSNKLVKCMQESIVKPVVNEKFSGSRMHLTRK